jgi:uncharacterized protein YqgC (DUF456 family)
MVIEIVIYIIAGALSLIGLGLTLISIPGIWLIFLATVLIALLNGFEIITVTTLIVIFLISLVSTFFDNILNLLGVKVFGGSIWGMVGAILGGIVGLFVGNIFGLILGPMIGATVFEFTLSRKDFKDSIKSGLGTFLGLLISILLKFSVAVGIVIYVLQTII